MVFILVEECKYLYVNVQWSYRFKVIVHNDHWLFVGINQFVRNLVLYVFYECLVHGRMITYDLFFDILDYCQIIVVIEPLNHYRSI